MLCFHHLLIYVVVSISGTEPDTMLFLESPTEPSDIILTWKANTAPSKRLSSSYHFPEQASAGHSCIILLPLFDENLLQYTIPSNASLQIISANLSLKKNSLHRLNCGSILKTISPQVDSKIVTLL